MAEFTPAQIIANMNSLGRATPVLDEVLSILHSSLPGALEALALPAIHTWDYAGVEIDPARFPAVLVGAAIRTDEWANRWADTMHLQVTVAYAPTITRRQLQDSLDIAQVVRGVLTMPTVMGPRYKAGAMVWNWLMPAGFSLVPPNFPYYRGWIAEFVCQQNPVQANLWGDPPQ
ncbi:MAG: hypothetical protein AB7Y46_16805 [Armatimonadota bacterium]